MKATIRTLFTLSALVLTTSCSRVAVNESRKVASTESVDSGDAVVKFSDYLHQYTGPQYFQSNTLAFDARLKLLDMAPKGGSVKIATFTVDNGPIVRQLARHICLAANRGVNVELLADSKSGEEAGSPNPFNISEDVQVVEEIYQYLANCGAKIYIHNHLDSYIQVMGQRLPNVFLNPSVNGVTFSMLGLLNLNSRLNLWITKIGDLVNAEMAASGLKGDSKTLLSNIKNFAMEFLQLQSTINKAIDVNNPPFGYASHVINLNNYYLALINDPIWDGISSAKQVRDLLPKIAAKFNADPELRTLRAEIHRFNRLNHRKLFMAESADGKEGCMILGGRNLGDHYLAGHRDAYLDGDVLLCRHESADQSAMLDAANQSFNQLKTDLSDAVLGLSKDNSVRSIDPDPNFAFSALSFPDDLAPKGTKSKNFAGSLSEQHRLLVKEKTWVDPKVVLGDLDLGLTSNWRLLTSTWDPAHDQIGPALIGMIQKESKEIYIETAYGEFNEPLRTAIEDALKRGVNIKIVTNSFFSSDGASKIIRILMANWVGRIKASYPNNFMILFTSYEGGHMTHFKGAAFACQKGDAGIVRSYILGSHNFHPRSGRDDKEHALVWDQSAETTCTGGFAGLNDIMQFRTSIYNEISKNINADVLEEYPDLITELKTVERLNKKPGDVPAQLMARAMIQVFYVPGAQVNSLQEEARVKWILKFLDNSGLHDLLGNVL